MGARRICGAFGLKARPPFFLSMELIVAEGGEPRWSERFFLEAELRRAEASSGFVVYRAES